mmetsp:Transcript_26476/g.36459  ORF Transcript_26476/g.36459 Transcript_26476/m.36459 type:complete len:700 (+) Transcript_26476:293-2392(+)
MKKPALIIRAKEYYLPVDIAEHVSAVFNTVQTPPVLTGKYRQLDSSQEEYKAMYKSAFRESIDSFGGPQGRQLSSSGTVTVSLIDSYYQISSNSNLGSSHMTQSVFETSQEYYSPSDLAKFQAINGFANQPAIDYNGYNTTSACSLTGGSPSCTEGNLDVQYIMGVAQVSPTIYWYTSTLTTAYTDPFTTWILNVAAETNPPQSNSLSWGALESSVTSSIQNTWNTEAMKLGLQGVTIAVASGDDGAPNLSSSGQCMCSVNNGYNPIFPASSPYVVAVGATMGPQSNTAEIGCQSQLGGVITSGGGFSIYNLMPSYQSAAVKQYFKNVASTSSAPTSGYSTTGRGYPDVALVGVNYQVVIAGQTLGVYGTSCSTPVFAAFVTLINGLRYQKGLKSSIGFINPTLYNNSKSFKDITSGSNKCCAYTGSNPSSATCCSSGFTTATGWDPMTGLGSISFPAMAALFNVTAEYSATTTSSGYTLSTLYIVLISLAGVFVLVACCTGLLFGLKRYRRRSPDVNNMVANPANPQHSNQRTGKGRRWDDDSIPVGENPTSRLSNVSRESGYAARSPMMTAADAPVAAPVLVTAAAVRSSPPPKPSRHNKGSADATDTSNGDKASYAPPPPPHRAPSPAPPPPRRAPSPAAQPPPPPPKPQHHANNDVAVQSLMNMGFSRVESLKALRSCHNDVQQAANQLLSGRHG